MNLESERELARLRRLTANVPRAVSKRRVTADRKVIESAGVYHGAFLLANGDGAATAVVYDGQDATGEPIDYLATSGATTKDDTWKDRGVILLHGLFVDLGSNVNAMVVYYDPPPVEEL